MTDEALGALDLFLDNAVLGKLNEVRIIHGKGTGAVRKAVREHLKRSRYVKTFRPGRELGPPASGPACPPPR